MARPFLGAHESVDGGYYKAVEIAARVGCACVQVFTNAFTQWHCCPQVKFEW